MRLVVVREQILMEPLVGFCFGLWLVKVIEGFMSFFNRPNGLSTLPLDRAVTRRLSLPLGMWVMNSMPRQDNTFWKTWLLEIGPLSA